jgi:hypothetical protein
LRTKKAKNASGIRDETAATELFLNKIKEE